MPSRVSNLLKSKKPLYFLINIGIMVSIVVVMILTFFYYYLPKTTRHGESITVPSLVGMNLSELDQFLGTRELRYQVNDSSYSGDVKPFTILNQNPAPGSKVKQNRKIYVTVSSKIPPIVKMPKLKDKSLREAEMLLKSYGLDMDVTYEPSPYSNLVLDQQFNNKTIEEGASIAKGSKIKLVVGNGTGTDKIEIPDLVGMPLDEAKISAAVLELQIEVFKTEFSPDHAPGTIIRQKPSTGSGRTMNRGEVIDLWVAQ